MLFALLALPILYAIAARLGLTALAPPPHLGGRLGYMEARRHEVARANAARINAVHVSGFYEFTFQGTETTQELLVDVVFPCWFVDKPSFAPGSELIRDILVEGQYPTLSATVVRWTKIHDVRPGGGYWTGATIAIVASGREGDEMILHWNMNGKAMSIPGGSELTDA